MVEIRHQDPKKQDIINKTIDAGQEHVFQWWESIKKEEKDRLLRQLETIDFDTLDDLYRKHAGATSPRQRGKITPVDAISVPHNKAQFEAAAEESELAAGLGRPLRSASRLYGPAKWRCSWLRAARRHG